MSTQIKRLSLGGSQFVPITLSEAVVVNTSNLTGLTNTITTLDKVLSLILGKTSSDNKDTNEAISALESKHDTEVAALQAAVNQINSDLETKQTNLTAGKGINISTDSNGKLVISVTNDIELYRVVTDLPDVSTTPYDSVKNIIHVVADPTGGNTTDENIYIEYLAVGSSSGYTWEKIGQFRSTISLLGYVTEGSLAETLKDYVTTDILTTTKNDLLGLINTVSAQAGTNADNISTLTGRMTTAEGNIAANTLAISDNSTAITTLQNSKVDAVNVTTSDNKVVAASYEIPSDLYDSVTSA